MQRSRDLLVVAESPSSPSPQVQPSVSTGPVGSLRAANVTVVRTALDLQKATQSRSVVDIEVQSHLDLSDLKTGPHPISRTKDESLLYVDSLRSIRVCLLPGVMTA